MGRRRKPRSHGLFPWVVLAAFLEITSLGAVDLWFWPSPSPLLDTLEDLLAERAAQLAEEAARAAEETEVMYLPSAPATPKPRTPRRPRPLRPQEQEKEKEPAPQVAAVPPPLTPDVPPPPLSPPQEQPAPQPPKLSERMKAVKIDDDENVVDKDTDARFLSDKNRVVKEETRAKDTNLERSESSKDDQPSEKSDDRNSKETGGPEERIRQMKDAEASARPPNTPTRSAPREAPRRVDAPERGGGTPGPRPGPLSMRGVEGRIAPGTPTEKEGEAGEDGSGRPGPRGSRPNFDLDFKGYQRVVGQDALAQEVEAARGRASQRKGRWTEKLARMRSSLETFTPDVKVGNQTALGTRAHPFAVYIAEMHLRIHEHWGFGFLEDLGSVPASDPMNRWENAVKLEMVLGPTGEIDRIGIVRGSGVLTYDAAAVQAMYAAGPFGPPPGAIKSANGKVYLHWTFHRDHRQCATDFAEPFILTETPSAPSGQGALPGTPRK